jgi:hypothetical protein
VSRHFRQIESKEPSRFRLCGKKGGSVRTIVLPLSEGTASTYNGHVRKDDQFSTHSIEKNLQDTMARFSASPLLPKPSCEPLRTDSARNPWQYLGMMKKKQNLKDTARTTIASVKREMEKPRLTESVRNDRKDQAAPVVEEPPTRSERL